MPSMSNRPSGDVLQLLVTSGLHFFVCNGTPGDKLWAIVVIVDNIVVIIITEF